MTLLKVLCCFAIVTWNVSSFILWPSNLMPSIFNYRRNFYSTFPTSLEPVSTTKLAASWYKRLQELKEYNERVGDTLVPRIFPENPPLGNWVNKQRQRKKKGVMSEEHISLLNEINFIWDAAKVRKSKSDLWWNRMQELKAIVDKSGYESIKSNSSIGFWMNSQRKQYELHSQGHISSLTEDMIHALNVVEFPWKSERSQRWNKRIRELLAYKGKPFWGHMSGREEYSNRSHQDTVQICMMFAAKHGDCIVPITYKANPQLANWVSSQRKNYNLRESGRISQLSCERIQQLESLGFVWNRWEHEFHEKHVEVSRCWSN